MRRAYTLQRDRPITLEPSIKPPTVADDSSDPNAHLLHDFVLQVSLFKQLDHDTTSVLTNARHALTPQLVTSLQKQMTDVLQSYVCRDARLLDIGTCRAWLNSTLWQLDPANDPVDSSMPTLARELALNLAAHLPRAHASTDLVGFVCFVGQD